MTEKTWWICQECGLWHGIYEVKVREQTDKDFWEETTKHWCNICNKYVEIELTS